MKKIATIALFCTAFIFGCTDKEEFHPNEAPKQEFNSRIEELEANGLKLFKKTITVTDVSEKNSVTLLYACTDDDYLKFYLENTKIALNVITAIKEKSSFTGFQSKTTGATETSPDESALYEHVVSKNLEDNVKGYTLSYTTNPLMAKQARIAWENPRKWHESERFDDWASVTWRESGNSNQGIFVEWRHLNCALCSWSSGFTINLYAGNEFSIYNPDARRLGCYVSHNWGNYRFDRGNY